MNMSAASSWSKNAEKETSLKAGGKQNAGILLGYLPP
jgi:hypothetical protein